jgi:hypothetical protein
MRRWHVIAQDQSNIQLELLPMLLGFFTYKGAVIGKQFVELMAEAAGSSHKMAGMMTLFSLI